MNKKPFWREPLLILSGIFISVALISGALLYNQITTTIRGETGREAPVEEAFNYTLRENATMYQQQIFTDLIEAQQAFEERPSDASKEAYARAVVKNFVADFFTWSNKEGRNDVGGLQFIDAEVRSSFRTQAVDHFYLYLNQFLELHEPEDLITVANVTIEEVQLDYGIEMEVELEEPIMDDFGNEVNTELEWLPVIRIHASWEYETSPLEENENFQNSAIFLLVSDGVHLSIRTVEEVAQEETLGYE